MTGVGLSPESWRVGLDMADTMTLRVDKVNEDEPDTRLTRHESESVRPTF